MTMSLVIGGTGIVGGYIVLQLVKRGDRPFVLSRPVRAPTDNITWVYGDLARPEALTVPPVETIYCTVDVSLLAAALPTLASASLKRVVAFTSTSIVTKLDSEIEAERQLLQRLADGERDLIAYCERAGIGWTILRPTIIYAEGRDGNISRLARLIERLGFLPLAGRGRGLRQPVHAEDLAIGAVAAAASPLAANQTYALPGTEVISYREMVGRIFDGLQKPRRLISLPVSFWRLAFMLAKPFFPNANVAMGSRMDRDLVFDPEPAIRDFNWAPRKFLPKFARSQ